MLGFWGGGTYAASPTRWMRFLWEKVRATRSETAGGGVSRVFGERGEGEDFSRRRTS